MPELVLTAAEKAVEQTFVDAAAAAGAEIVERPPSQSSVDMFKSELEKELSPEEAAPFVEEFKNTPWYAVSGKDNEELGLYKDKYQLGRAFCRKYSLKGYPAHLDKEAQFQLDQVETKGLNLPEMAAAAAEQAGG